MANDQFLESQRLLMIDMKRMGSVLTEEQQRKVEGWLLLYVSNDKLIHILYSMLGKQAQCHCVTGC